MGLEKILTELVIRLNRPLLFFIPKDIVPTQEMASFDTIETKGFFDTVVLYANNGRFNENISGSDYIQLMEKPTVLSHNILRLVDEQAGLNSSQFTTLLEKYSVHFRFFVFISKWMADNVDAHCTVDKNINAYFKFQKDAYQHHKQEVERKFGLLIITDLTSSEILSYIKEDTPTTISEVINKENITKDNIRSGSIDIQQKSNPKKQLLISDEEARKFLLDTVFNRHE